MVLFRALGWLLLVMAVAAVVNDALTWWSDGSFHLLGLGELWSRLDVGSFAALQELLERLWLPLWSGFMLPIFKAPALPVFVILGLLCLWLGQPRESEPETGYVIGTRAPRRRRGRNSLL